MWIASAIVTGLLTISGPAGRAPADLPSIDEYICLKCDDVVTAPIREQHFAGKIARPERGKDCRAACVFDSKPVSTVVVHCGRSDEEGRSARLFGNAKPLAGLEDNGQWEILNDDYIVSFTDRDTPCSVILHSDPKDPTSEAKAIALGRDVAKVLTPELIAKRRTVEAIVWAEDKTGQKAQAALGAWDKEAAALKELGTLSTGFPKVIDHKDKPGLPEGKKSLLLGYCPTGQADPVVTYWKGALPGLAWNRVSAEGAALSCPEPAHPYDGLVSKKLKVGKDELTVVAFVAHTPTAADNATNRGGFLSVQAFLRDKGARLLDAKQQRYGGAINAFGAPKIKPTDGGLTVHMDVSMGSYPECNPRPTYPVKEKITVADGKIAITEDEGPIPFCECCGGE